uniref:N4-gp56 family major capsid protein n=2 Tax=Leptospirillum ferriphilum TaxID=178606 RepID=A0A7C3QY31_9BACT
MAFNMNTQSQFTADVVNYIDKRLLEIAQRDLVFHQFGSKLEFPKQRGLTYTAVQYQRVALPQNALNEGVPPNGKTMTLSTVTGTAQQWGDLIEITDVGEITIFHPLFQEAINMAGLAAIETMERNMIDTLMTGTQVYYSGGGSTRTSVGTNVLSATDLGHVLAKLRKYGAPAYNGPKAQPVGKESDQKSDPRILRTQNANTPHYVGVIHPSVEQDLINNATITLAYQYSQPWALYNGEVGQWSGVRFCRSNMIPEYTSGTGPTLSASGSGSSLAAVPTYVVVTGVDTQNFFESVIYTETNITPTAGENITLTTPNTPGFVYNVYVGTASGAERLSQSSIAANTPVTISALPPANAAAVPPALGGATDVVVPTFVFGQNAYGVAPLDKLETTYLREADKFDPLNQVRMVGWKFFEAYIITQPNFMYRIESSTAFA